MPGASSLNLGRGHLRARDFEARVCMRNGAHLETRLRQMAMVRMWIIVPLVGSFHAAARTPRPLGHRQRMGANRAPLLARQQPGRSSHVVGAFDRRRFETHPHTQGLDGSERWLRRDEEDAFAQLGVAGGSDPGYLCNGRTEHTPTWTCPFPLAGKMSRFRGFYHDPRQNAEGQPRLWGCHGGPPQELWAGHTDPFCRPHGRRRDLARDCKRKLEI